MKAIICFAHGDMHIHSFTTEWTPCACGNVKAKWVDPMSGTVLVAAKDYEKVRILGLNNHYLIPATLGGGDPTWQAFRQFHDLAVNAPGYIFDKEKASCWAVVISVGRSNDVRRATPEEYKEAFGQDEPCVPPLSANSTKSVAHTCHGKLREYPAVVCSMHTADDDFHELTFHEVCEMARAR